MTLQHLRSSTANKRPTPGAMSDGQLAVNTNANSTGLFFKDSSGALVKVGPVHIGTTAPNISPASGGASGNTVGEQWLDTTGGSFVLKIWDGSAWRSEAGEFVNATGDTMTGALGIIAGSASSPSLFFSGDTNTGLYSPGADQVAISTNGVGRLFVDASGNVGIGGAPSNALQVESSADSNQGIWVRNTSTGTSASSNVLINSAAGQLAIRAHSAAHGVWPATATVTASSGLTNGLAFNTGTAAPIAFLTNNSERMRIDSSGRLLVNTSSSPSAGDGQFARLAVQGSIGGDTCYVSFARNAPATSITTGQGLGVLAFTDNTGNTFGSISCLADAGAGSGDYPGRLVFSTTADGASGPTERMRIDSSGRVGIGTTSPALKLHAEDSSSQIVRWTRTGVGAGSLDVDGSGNAVLNAHTTSTGIAFHLQASEKARIDSSGRLLVGASTARSAFYNTAGSTAAALQVEGNDNSTAALSIVANTSANANAPHLIFGKSAGTAVGSNTLVGANVNLGRIAFQGNDGTEFVQAAEIRADVDGTPGANNMPGRIVLSTTADGAASPTERMRIDSSGRVGIGVTNPTRLFHANDSANEIVARFSSGQSSSWAQFAASGNGTASRVGSPDGSATASLAFMTNDAERARIDSSGRLLVGTSSARSNFFNGTNSAGLQIEGASGNASRLSMVRSDGGGGPTLILGRQNSGAVGGNTAVTASGSFLGGVSFQGNDGSEFVEAAAIYCETDATCSANDMPGRLVFSTTADGASSPTERMRITSTGQVRLAGAGITFNGDTATANELDDYEEGTWTPVYVPNTGAFSAITYDPIRYGKYTKVGNLVTCSFAIRTDALTVGTASGPITLQGLPFTSASTAGFDAGGGSLNYSSTFGGDNPTSAVVIDNSTTCELYYRATSNGVSTAFDTTDLGTGANNNYMLGTLSYFVS